MATGGHRSHAAACDRNQREADGPGHCDPRSLTRLSGVRDDALRRFLPPTPRPPSRCPISVGSPPPPEPDPNPPTSAYPRQIANF